MAVVTRKVALVTGGGHGVGHWVAGELARLGWTVGLQYAPGGRAAAESVLGELQRIGGQGATFACDLAREDEAERLVPAVAGRLGALQLLVHAEALAIDDTAQTADRFTWDRQMAVNLRAPFLLAQGLARQLPAGEDGHVLLLVDQRAGLQAPHFLSYGLAQAGALALVRSLALGLAPRVRVNGFGPAAPLPGSEVTLPTGDPAAEICRTLRFILETPCLTGQVLALDGNEALGWPALERTARSDWAGPAGYPPASTGSAQGAD